MANKEEEEEEEEEEEDRYGRQEAQIDQIT
jgi:hypothetical protein